jgi:hypothetical protein
VEVLPNEEEFTFFITMTPRKGVRFSDGQPSQQQQQQWDVPAFSPTQVPKKEKVLHSIFSPSHRLTEQPTKADNEYEVLVDPAIGPTTPARKSSMAQSSYDHLYAPTAASSPMRGGPPKVIHGEASDADENDFFFSPRSANVLSPMSGITEITEASPIRRTTRVQEEIQNEHPASTSFDTLHTIDMLNFNFLHSCESTGDLERVVNLLSEQNDSPHLFRAAIDRLEDLQQKNQSSRVSKTAMKALA